MKKDLQSFTIQLSHSESENFRLLVHKLQREFGKLDCNDFYQTCLDDYHLIPEKIRRSISNMRLWGKPFIVVKGLPEFGQLPPTPITHLPNTTSEVVEAYKIYSPDTNMLRYWICLYL